jgi:hypothetical protein
VKATTRRQVRSRPQDLIDLFLDRDEVEQGEALSVVNEQVDVAVRAGLVPPRGAEQVERADP